MKSRQKKKHVRPESESDSRVELMSRSFCHLNRSLRQFSEGLQTRFSTLQERLVVEPLESAAWGISQRVRKVQNRVFDFIDAKISLIEEARHRKIDHQTALERFDSEGGAMQATPSVPEVSALAGQAKPVSGQNSGASKTSRFSFEPSPQH